MTIRNKLLAGMSILLIVMFCIAGLGMNRLTTMNRDIGASYGEMYDNVKDSQQFQIITNEIGRNLVSLMLNNPVLTQREILERLARNDQDMRKLFEDARAKYRDARQAQVTEEAIEAITRYLSYKDTIVKEVMNNRLEEAVLLRSSEGLKLQQEIQEKNDALGSYNQNSMDQVLKDGTESNRQTLHYTISLMILGLVLVLMITYWIIQSISKGLNRLSALVPRTATDTLAPIEFAEDGGRDEISQVIRLFNRLFRDLSEQRAREQEFNRKNEEEAWLKTQLNSIMLILQGRTNLKEVGERFVRQIAPLVEAVYGGFYVSDSGQPKPGMYTLVGSYAVQPGEIRSVYHLGQGLVGQCAADNRWIKLRERSAHPIRVELSPGELALGEVLIIPLAYEGNVVAVLEIGSVHPFSPRHVALLEQVTQNVGAVLNSIMGRIRVEELLRTSQILTEELQTQSEELLTQSDELRMTNEKLEEQAEALRKSEELLQQQQEELAATNEELTLKTTLLEEQVRVTKEKNIEVERANKVLEHQAVELELASRYKSEFLANMSHELRTPLNSMMILSLMLQENREGNLTEKQREYAAAIHGAGGDLLRLINDVLDLSKVEAGHMEIHVEPLEIKEIVQYVERSFMPVSVRKGVELAIRTAEALPEVINTDSQRLMQIIGNLMSNAFKFTEEGRVTFRLELSDGMWLFMIEDTGIGIPDSQQEEIFQAFRQADGTISRNFGGTGLGLSISQKLAKALGGNITVTSGVGAGSTFILWIPLIAPKAAAANRISNAQDPIFVQDESAGETGYLPDMAAPLEAAVSISAEEDNDSVTDSYLHKILIVDDDIRNVFALSVALEDAGLQVVFAENGVDALEMLNADNHGIDLVLMDIMMPRMDGYEAIRKIRRMPELSGLPIIAVTAKAMKEDQQRCMDAGASDYLTKPIDIGRLLSLLKVWLHKEE
ncbi:response regulator [Paenibacillus sp. YN15]|uniref:response regulator n=1 Tax=Paenibacillus sp. YN15 TaxID=1742774 RepID=UPI000DCB8B62|nr:response regulator [Paenibacillus sp. YN15]RAV02310.1 hypothetical protein DQG13_09765 [Paenibacillus sp. YN15]